MQNKYVGDVGDFGKYGMIRALFSNSPYKLGVNWCLVEKEEKKNDGKHTTYLNIDGNNPREDLEKQFKPCDEELYRALQHLVSGQIRRVEAVEESQLLGRETIYFREEQDSRPPRYARGDGFNRTLWHQHGLKALKKMDVVFFDPDNGMEVKAFPKSSKKHIKYVYYDELADYYSRGQSLIVYQHRDMKPIEKYLERFFSVLESPAFTKPIGKMFLLRFHRFGIRDYFLVLHPEHVEEITQRVSSMIAGRWGSLFDRIELEEA